MKYLLCILCFYSNYICFSQSTHHAVVHINQPLKCAVVSTEQVQLEEVHVYPNPAKNILHVLAGTPSAQIDIRDQLGRPIFRNRLTDDASISINVESFNRGIYYVIIRNGASVTNSKIVLH
jgi:hypothetical protein